MSKAISEPIDQKEYERKRAQWFNDTPGNLTGYDCPKCKNRGTYYVIGEDGAMFSRECSCMAVRRSIQRLKQSGLEDMLQRYTFDNWETPQRWHQTAKDLANAYVSAQQGWFLAAGHSGSGKTHLCTAICGKLLEHGLETRYMLWRDVAVQAKAVVNDEEAYYKLIDPLKRVRVLYIDDLYKTGRGQQPTTGDVNLAFEILNSRYNDSSKLTIISTERSIGDLLDIDEAIGSRIYERSKGFRLDFSDKPNWRLST